MNTLIRAIRSNERKLEIMTVIYAILIFCMLIFIHELGHFTVAKLCGMKVNEFAIGMGPAFFKKQKGETLYALRIFPIGGYCALEGEDEDTEDERAFSKSPIWQRALVLAAGSFMNLLMAVILLIIIALCVGEPTTTINQVVDKSPAYEAGLEVGDTIVGINGEPIKDWKDLQIKIGEAQDKEMQIEMIRDGETVTTNAVAMLDASTNQYKIGISPTSEKNVLTAIPTGIRNTGNMTVMMFDALGDLFTGKLDVKELSGPVGIVYAVNSSAKEGPIYVLYLAALLSLNLAIINMLPLPALDGGRLLILGARKVTGNRLTTNMEGQIHFIGILLLLALMLYVTWNDIIRFITPLFG